MIAEFFISTIIVGIIGSIIIYSCRTKRKKLEEESKIKIEKLEKIYLDERVKNNEELEKFRSVLETKKKEYSSKKGNT